MEDRDTLLVSAMIGVRLCLRCASTRSDIEEHDLVGIIRRIQRSIYVIESVDACDACGRRTIVYRIR
jgi:hypothetical protein